MSAPRAVLFDLWHTLVYLEPAAEEDYMAQQLDIVTGLLEQWPRSPRARHPPLRDARRAAEESRAQAVQEAAHGRSVSLAVQALHAARRLGRIARPIELVQALTSLVERTPFRRVQGASEVLAALHASSYRLGVISNTIGEPGEALQRQLERAGVAESVDSWAFSDQLPWAKPAPEIFWHCLGVLDTLPGRAVHVGDGWSDLAGARAAGLRAGILFTGSQKYGAAYRRLFAPPNPELDRAEFRIDRLEALPELVARLLPE